MLFKASIRKVECVVTQRRVFHNDENHTSEFVIRVSACASAEKSVGSETWSARILRCR